MSEYEGYICKGKASISSTNHILLFRTHVNIIMNKYIILIFDHEFQY